MNDSMTPQLGQWALTGAAGRIGQHLRASMGWMFDELIVMDIVPVEPIAANERAIQLDLKNLDGLRAALHEVEGVIHLGGLSDESDFHELVEVNIVGSFHLLEAARAQRVRRVVYASSNRVTGFYPTTHHTLTTDPPRPDGLYGVSKAAVEILNRLYADKFGLSIGNVRIGSYETEPSTPRELSTWLSPDDCTAAFVAAVTGSYDFATFYAVSANTNGWWSQQEGAAIGYAPTDDAENFRASISGDAMEPQAGDFAAPSFTLGKQSHVSRWAEEEAR